MGVTHLHHMDQIPKEGRRAIEIESLLHHASSRSRGTQRIATVIAGDFNQARLQDYTAAEWAVIAAGLSKVQQPRIDGVPQALQKAGFVCAYDSTLPQSNFGGRAAPAFTHWTGTTVDYLYLLDEGVSCKSGGNGSSGQARIHGTYVLFTNLSDHLPVVMDLDIEVPD